MTLYQHDRDFLIRINGEDLMHSRQHESERELARLGCAHLSGRRSPAMLIGGLGMGYTLRRALDMLGPGAEVVMAELMDAVVEWNRTFLGELNARPLSDDRVSLETVDIVEILLQSEGRFDAILLDVDNGPRAMTDSANSRLYGYEGIGACRRALRAQGCLAVWSAAPNKEFEQLIMDCGFQTRRYRVPAYKGKKAQSRFVWVASENKGILPPGGGEPREPGKKGRKGAKRGRGRGQG